MHAIPIADCLTQATGLQAELVLYFATKPMISIGL